MKINEFYFVRDCCSYDWLFFTLKYENGCFYNIMRDTLGSEYILYKCTSIEDIINNSSVIFKSNDLEEIFKHLLELEEKGAL